MKSPTAGTFLRQALPLLILAWSVAGCNSVANLSYQLSEERAKQRPVRYSLVFVVHGDGSYLYHDTRGAPHRSDQDVMARARRVAEATPDAEVFIFHQQPGSSLLGLFEQDDGKFVYYRNGQKQRELTYRRDNPSGAFQTEAKLFHKHTANHSERYTADDRPFFFFYFGHEIPLKSMSGYCGSYPEQAFGVSEFVSGLNRFSGGQPGPFIDLLVVAACNSGNAVLADAVAGTARYLLASPGDLHLSSLDLRILPNIDGIDDIDVHAFARILARKEHEELCKRVQTQVTLAVYDLQKVAVTLGPLADAVAAGLRDGYRPGMRSIDCMDCAVEIGPELSSGVEVFHRPARFGPEADRTYHSGWGCWPSSKEDTPSTTPRVSGTRQ